VRIRCAVNGLCFSPDGRRLAGAGDDRTIHVWDPERGHELYSLKGHADTVERVAFSPDGSRLVSGGGDGTIKVWPAVARQAPAGGTLGRAELRLDASARGFSPDGNLLAAGCSDGQVRAWDARSGRPAFVFRAHRAPVYGVAFSPYGKRLATA